VLGRNPDTRWYRQKKDLERFQQKQLALLDSAANLLKAGGVLVYAVCSMEPEENEEVVETFLHSRPDFEKVTSPDALHPKVSPFVGTSGYFKTFPHLHGMDGFFGARLKRQKDGEKAGAF
jgi:16S rRNA (cytosine967-C5)-methyltransferase